MGRTSFRLGQEAVITADRLGKEAADIGLMPMRYGQQVARTATRRGEDVARTATRRGEDVARTATRRGEDVARDITDRSSVVPASKDLVDANGIMIPKRILSDATKRDNIIYIFTSGLAWSSYLLFIREYILAIMKKLKPKLKTVSVLIQKIKENKSYFIENMMNDSSIEKEEYDAFFEEGIRYLQTLKSTGSKWRITQGKDTTTLIVIGL